MGVQPFKMKAGFAQRIIREAAQDSRNIVIPEPPAGGKWEATITLLQVKRCLEDGEIIGEPTLNEYGDWECTMVRFATGVEIYVTVAVMKQGDNWELFVKEVTRQ